MNKVGKQLRCHSSQMRGIGRVITVAMVPVLSALSARAVAGDTERALSPADASVRSNDTDFTNNVDALIAFFRNTFDTTEFKPRWKSETWSTAHASLHIGSDL